MRFSHHWFVFKIRSVTQAVTYAHGDQKPDSSLDHRFWHRKQMLPHEEAHFRESGAVSADTEMCMV